MTKPKEKDGVTKYSVNRRVSVHRMFWSQWPDLFIFDQPIPLDLLTLVNFTDPPTQRSKGILGGLRGGDRNAGTGQEVALANGASADNDARWVFPCTIHHNGRLGGLWTVYAESAQARTEWKQKLDEAIVLRKVVTDANKVFEIETLSCETFCVPSMHATQTSASWNEDHVFTGKVTCSVPFCKSAFHSAVAESLTKIRHGSNRGWQRTSCYWMCRGRLDWSSPRSQMYGTFVCFAVTVTLTCHAALRRVLHLKMVTQCAMLEDFGIFLVLADKVD